MIYFTYYIALLVYAKGTTSSIGVYALIFRRNELLAQVTSTVLLIEQCVHQICELHTQLICIVG